ncbi:helix-turn-helix domain-containing protein [Aerococcaceae bacterium NML160702]|nr:helix-turn-helix domain-containing protein [Aerococcaceae bacterium NML160702]
MKTSINILIGTRLKELRLHANLEQQDVANHMGYKSDSTISKWENGKNLPNGGKLAKLAKLYNTTTDYILHGADKNDASSLTLSLITETTSKLTENRQQNVLSFAKSQLEEQDKVIQADFIKEHQKLYAVHAQEAHAAGVGYAYEGTGSLDTYYTDRDDLKAYDYASLVSGDSMEPQIKNGDVILIKQGYDNVDGGIYSVDYDGKSYLKKVYLQGGQFIMKSINKKYDDIIIDLPLEDTYLNIIGKVVDWFTPVEK